MNIINELSELVGSVVAFVVMILLGIASFFVTVFIVREGSALAGYSPSGDFVVLSASLIVVAAIIAGSKK